MLNGRLHTEQWGDEAWKWGFKSPKEKEDSSNHIPCGVCLSWMKYSDFSHHSKSCKGDFKVIRKLGKMLTIDSCYSHMSDFYEPLENILVSLKERN